MKRSARAVIPVLACTSAAALVAALAAAPASAAARPTPRLDNPARVHLANGRPLTAASPAAPGQVVRDFVRTTGGTAADVLRTTSTWTAHGVQQVRLQQYAHGLRVHGAYVRGAVDGAGRLLGVIDATAPDAPPAAASIGDDDARDAAVRSLGSARLARPAQVERVAVPTTDGGLATAFEVTTWDTDNQLVVTLVSGDGQVLDAEHRTANESYNVFAVDPSTSRQAPYSPAADWLLSGPQTTRSISGTNVHAYRDANADNAPDPGGTPVSNGIFSAAFDPTAQPDTGTNPDVAVQNLFYLNNVLHDTLRDAGFTAAAGNFEGSDPVLAEAQDGGGTDNANFATPRDGQSPTMQMYLWNAPVTHELAINGTKARFDATGATWGPALTAAGVSGTLVRASVANACTTIAPVPTGSLVVADRGACDFTTKALNAQTAGAKGLVVVNNVDGAAITMGGTSKRVTIPGVMVRKADGTKLPIGSTATMRLIDPKPLMRDGDLDSDIVYHEYGHGLTWRMIGAMDGPLAGAIGEGMSDVLSEVLNDNPVVGEYSLNDPAGIRRASYDGYNVITYGDITGAEVHDDGELYGAIGWDLWQAYKRAKLTRSALLTDLVDGMNYTPAGPTFEQMRDGILAGLAARGSSGRSCTVWNAFARHGVGVGAKGVVRGKSAAVSESFTVPAGC